MTSEEIIDEILHEAAHYNVMIEVIEGARKIMEEKPEIDRVMAYSIAYHEWVK